VAELILPAKHTLNGVEPLLEYRGIEERLAPVLVQIVLQCESANSQPFEFVDLYRSTLR
jgi:hypothetical protein